MTGTPTIVEVGTSDLTLASKTVNTATYVEAYTGNTVAIGSAVGCSVLGGTAANSPYMIQVTVSTDAAVARTFVRTYSLKWG